MEIIRSKLFVFSPRTTKAAEQPADDIQGPFEPASTAS
jgi:hypothetical protein